MINLGLPQKPLMEKLCTIFLFAVLCFVFLSHACVYAETEASAPAQSPTNVLESPQIDRIIPSKLDDLFVVLRSGLTVLIRESLGSKVVSSQVLVKTGLIYEGESQ